MAEEGEVLRLSGERRHVTALFYDVVGSTELLHANDAEDVGAALGALHKAAAATIAAHGGHLDSTYGDGGSAFFGVRSSEEHAAEDAVAAAQEILARAGAIGRALDAPLKVRVGLSTGVVVVAAAGAPHRPSGVEITGMAPVLAARLQSVAEPETIVVSESTFRLAQAAFQFQALGPRVLKGFPEPVPVWRPLERRVAGERFPAYRRAGAPLVGRSAELAACQRLWREAVGGEGRLLHVHGDAGIGKSRLVAALREAVGEALVVQCQPRGKMRPLHPFVDRFRSAAGAVEATGAAIAAADLALAEAIFAPGRGEERTPSAEAREQAIALVARLLTAAAPPLLVIEDAHWADTMTEAVIEALAAAVATLPRLVVVTSRDAPSHALAATEGVARLKLERLDKGAVGELVARIRPEPPRRLVEFVSEKSDGVPLFAEELTLFLAERFGARAASEVDWQAALDEGGILTLQDLIAARLEELGELRRLTQVASVIGRAFAPALLAALLDAVPRDVHAGLARLAGLGVVERAGDKLRFRHALIQEQAYDSLLKADRRELHAKIIALVEAGATEATDEALAWHFRRAGRPAEAARHAVRAAEDCVARSALNEARLLLDIAERQVSLCPEGAAADELTLSVLTAKGIVSAALSGRGAPETRDIYERGVGIAQALEGCDRSTAFTLYWGWWFISPDYRVQQSRAEVLLRDLHGANDPEVRLQAYHCAWATSQDAGLHAHCLDCVDKGLELYCPERARVSRTRFAGHDARVCGLGERAFSLWFVGDDAGSADSIAGALSWARKIDHRESFLHALEYDVELKGYRTEFRAVISVADAIMRLAETLPFAFSKAALFRAWAVAMAGDVDVGAEDFAAATERRRAIATSEGAPLFESMRAQILVQQGRLEEAVAVLTATLAAAADTGQVFWSAELHRLRALALARLGAGGAEVDAEFSRALDLSRAQGAQALAARATRDVARLGLSASV